MILILVAHFVAALIAPMLVRAMGRNAFYPLALVPAASAAWIATFSPIGLASTPYVEVLPWMPTFGVSLTFRLDVLSWVMMLIVTGIGALVVAYCARYFKDTEPGLARFAGVLMAFAGAMAGLVIADDVMVMFTFWELTTVFSYLLIGHYLEKRASRRAAMNALISTTIGGLAMMVGLLILAVQAGTMSMSSIVQDPMWETAGPSLIVAMLLIMAGAASKSALVPTHFWLPGAMAAPTPVSAYLHAAAMVKAGIFLILRMAPVIALLPSIQVILGVLGAVTMIVGGWRALRQTDIKLLLAYGTVSQLGFMAAVASLGNEGASLAALSLLIAHAVFKAPLFMVVGIIDKKFGTRDLRVLHGVGRASPVIAAIGIISAASMAGIPPLFGFISKEAVLASLWYSASTFETGLLIALVSGSILTVAYAWRFVRGAFGPADDDRIPETAPSPAIPVLYWLPPALIGTATIVFAIIPGAVETVLRGYSDTVPALAGNEKVHLVAIPPIGIPLLLSVIALAGGAVLALLTRPFSRIQTALSPQTWGEKHLDVLDAERGFRKLMRGTDTVAVWVISLFQRGSLPYTLGTMLIVLILLTAPILASGGVLPDNLVWFFSPAEVLVLAVVAVASIGAARSRRRMRAVLLITGTGFAAATFFLLWGASDVATTQVLVETMLTIVVVLVLRRLPVHFSRRPLKTDQFLRWGIAIGTAVVLCSVTVYAAGARTADPLGPGLIDEAYTIGGGHNVVNVTLVDARVWDTFGELSVLLAVATGVASLIFITSREQRIPRVREVQGTDAIWRHPEARTLPENVLNFDSRPDGEPMGNRWRTWLSAGRTLAPERRIVILEVITRVAFPLMMMFSVYLLIAGHNYPGGGFAGGLVAGLAVAMRYLAGGRYELIEAMPVHAGHVLGVGMAIATLSGVMPLLFGKGIFESINLSYDLPVLGYTHIASALVFDVGVYLVVLGVALDFLRSLGAQIDLQQEAELDAR
ncbi:MAG: Na+/H+ antiporter subunit A [Brachybacterium sp.]|nr:Na+/H+ antiporter subunit A [Brachybacterium sp.]